MSEHRGLTQLAIVGAIILAIGGGIVGAIIWNNTGGSSGSTASGAAAQSAQVDMIDQIKKRGVLRMGCASSPPTVYQKGNGEWAGPDLLPAQDVASALHVKFECVSADWSNIVTGLQAGRYDFAADLDQTTERAVAIQYTDPVWSYPGVFLVPRSDTQHQTSKAILGSKQKVTTASGTAEDLALRAVNANVLRLPNYQDTTFALVGHRALAAFYDVGTAVTYARKYKQLCIVVPQPSLFVHGVAYGVPVDADAHTIQVMNVAIKNMRDSGEIAREFAKAGYVDERHLGGLECSAS